MMQNLDDIDPGDEKDPLSFGRLAKEARNFVLSHAWCRGIRHGYQELGFEGILAVWRFGIEPAYDGVDDSIWVIVGDLPPAYLCSDPPDALSALRSYVEEMEQWVEAAETGRPVDDLIPVNSRPTREFAAMLRSRLKFIKERIIQEGGLSP